MVKFILQDKDITGTILVIDKLYYLLFIMITVCSVQLCNLLVLPVAPDVQSVCVFVCVTSPRWGHGGHEFTGEDSNFGGIHAEVAHFLQMEGAVCVQVRRRASNTVPHRRWGRFCRGSDPSTIKPSKSSASLDLHSSVPPYHHTPWGPLSWQSDRSTLTASSG